MVNPLQHLPVVGSIYRELTGDSLAPGPRLAGGTLFGGPLGFATSLANVMVESVSGRDIGENVFAAMGGDTLFGDGPVEAADATAAGAAAIAPAAGPAAAPVAAAPTAVAMAPAARSAASPAGAIHPVALTVAGPANTASAVPQLPAGAMTAAPSLSPEAFQALMDSIGAKPAGGPAAAAPAVPAAPSAAQPLPEPADAGRAQDAALEVHQILQSFAASRGGGAIPVKR